MARCIAMILLMATVAPASASFSEVISRMFFGTPSEESAAKVLTPEELTALHGQMQEKSNEEHGSALTMNSEKDTSAGAKKDKDKEAMTAEKAEYAHLDAADAHTVAQTKANDAAAAWEIANAAKATADQAMLTLTEEQDKEDKARFKAAEAEKLEQKIQVEFEYATTKMKNTKAAADECNKKSEDAKAEKKRMDDILHVKLEEQTDVTDKMDKADAAKVTAKQEYDDAVADFDHVKAALDLALAQEVDLKTEMGTAETLCSKSTSERDTAEENRAKKKKFFDEKVASFHEMETVAAKMEAEANAARTEASAAATKATTAAEELGAMTPPERA